MCVSLHVQIHEDFGKPKWQAQARKFVYKVAVDVLDRPVSTL